MTTKRRNYEELGDEAISGELAERIDTMTAQADKDVEEARVNFRWGKTQVDVVKQAASLMGVPYQTFIKQTVFERALADLSAARASGVTKG